MSTDDDVRQAGMAARWPTPHVRYVADPGGETYLQPLGLFNPDERGGIALPGMIVIAPDGTEVYRYVGRDFADRTTDDDVLDAVEGLGLEPIDAPDDGLGSGPGSQTDGGVSEQAIAELHGFFAPENFRLYFTGNRFAAVAIGGRLEDDAAKAVAREHRIMCDNSLAAWKELTA